MHTLFQIKFNVDPDTSQSARVFGAPGPEPLHSVLHALLQRPQYTQIRVHGNLISAHTYYYFFIFLFFIF